MAFIAPQPLPLHRAHLFQRHSSRPQVHRSPQCAARRLIPRSNPHPSQDPSSNPATARPAGRPKPRKRQRNPTPLSSQSEYLRALELSTRRDKRAARAAFRAAANAAPDDGRIWVAWGQMEARIGCHAAARKVFADGAAANPTNSRLLHAWAVSEERGGAVDDARRLFLRCLDLAPRDGVAWQALALLEERAGDTEAARKTFRQGAEADDGNAHLWSAWGVLEMRHDRLDQAARMFERALQINPRHVHSYQAWAITAEKQGEEEKSASLFGEAIRLNPRSPPTLQAFALFEARRGNLDKARELFQRGVDVDDRHAPLWHAWAVMEQKDGNHDKARELFQKGVRAAPNNTAMLRAWARMELDLGHIDKSKDWMVPRGQRGKPGPRKGDGGKQMSAVAENLMMLRLMIERKSDEDVKAVMKWIDSRADSDRRLYDSISERPSNDLRAVREWVQRRSESDIGAFKAWLEDKYEKDRRIGVYIFNWDIPARNTAVVREPQKLPTKPVEWLMLKDAPEMELHAFDEELYIDDDVMDYADGVYFLGKIAEGLADRAALVFCLGTMSIFLVLMSAHLHELGYSPSSNATLQSEEELAAVVTPPSGVDAVLYEEGGAESVAEAASKRASRTP